MEMNLEPAAMSAVQADDSVKSRILERIKNQMARDSFDPGSGTGTPIGPIYLKAPDDDWPR